MGERVTNGCYVDQTGLKHPPRLSVDEIPNDHDVNTILENMRMRATKLVHHRNRALVALMFDTGLRVGEVMNLTLDDVLYRNGSMIPTHVIVRHGKTEASETSQRLTDRAGGILFQWITMREKRDVPREAPLFCTLVAQNRNIGGVNEPFQKLKYAQINVMFHREGERIGLARMCPHDARHSYAMRMMRATGNMDLVRRACRHASMRSTLIYARAQKEDVENAIMSLGAERRIETRKEIEELRERLEALIKRTS